MKSTSRLISDAQIESFERDGAVMLPGLLADWVGTISDGIERNLNSPGDDSNEYIREGDGGRFFGDYCNWQRIPEFRQVIFESSLAAAAAALMRSNRVQFFHDHVLVKEAGSDKETPWHQDAPYYFVDGEQSVSFWIPVDPVDEATLRLIAGSHKWPRPVLPTRWLSQEGFYADEGDYLPVPDPDAEPERFTVQEWRMQPGDAVAFHFRTVHGARGNPHGSRRRVLSLRFVGDDARFTERPGTTSPPYPGHAMKPGQRLREDWFPYVPVDGQAPDS